MIYAAFTMILLYYFVFMIYYQKLFPASGIKIIQLLLTLILVAAAYLFLDTYSLRFLNMPVIMLIMISGLRFTTCMNWLQAVYGGSICVLSAYCFRGIFAAINAFVFQKQDFLSYNDVFYAVTLSALPSALLFFGMLRKTILPDNKLKWFLFNRSQLKLVVSYELGASVNLLIVNSGRYLSPHNLWYMGIVFGSSILTLGMLIYAIYQSIQSTELLEFQYKSQMLEKQYERQLSHYKSYQKYTESFREFKHDYKSMMASLKSLIRARENEKAIQLIDGIYDDMQKKVHVHKKYSDHVVLDVMLQDLANICIEKEIQFSFQVYAPRNTSLSLPDAIRIFSNVTNNAVEACEKLSISKRFIHITSSTDHQWVVLEVVNSCNSEISIKNGKYITSKKDKDGHGMGLRIVSRLVENMGGFVLCRLNLKNKTFMVRIHIPQIRID